MGNNIKNFNERDYVKVIRAYLIEAKSHRQIQEEILGIDAPSRGGGFVAMEILHHFGISGSKKGILKKNSLDEEYLNATGSYKQGLELLKR